MLKSKKAKVFITGLAMSFFIAHPAYAATYRVAEGDSLYTIGKLFSTSANTIMSDNKLSSDVIHPGQILYVKSDTYTVKSGDTLYLIAKKYGISLDSLRKANNKWDNWIYPGDRLVLPGIISGQNQSFSNNSTTSLAVVSYTSSEFDLLARLINAEAEDQPYEAKVAVGAVVINRVQSSEFPNTISAVINQRINGYYQFTPVLNGWINRPATDEAKRAALDALNGVDPTNGALFYFDDSATNQWLWSKPLAIRIDKMVFTY